MQPYCRWTGATLSFAKLPAQHFKNNSQRLPSMTASVVCIETTITRNSATKRVESIAGFSCGSFPGKVLS